MPPLSEPTKRECKIAENKCDLGVCLIAKRVPGTCSAVLSGFVAEVGNLFPNWKRNICIITSGKIDLKKHQYLLYFKKLKLNSKVKRIKLERAKSSKDTVEIISGLAFIPLDERKLTRYLFWKSSILTDRPFTVSKERSLHGSVCFIVDGHTDGFTVKAFHVECVGDKYALKLKEKDATFKSLSKLTAKGSNNLHPHGAVILKNVNNTLMAVGVLAFVDDEISPVLFSRLQDSQTGKRQVKSRPSAFANGKTASTSQRREEQSDTLEDLSDEPTSQHGGPSDGFGNEFSSSSECVDSASKLQSSINARQQKEVSKLLTDVREQPRHELHLNPYQGKRHVKSRPSAFANGMTASTSQRREEQSDTLEDLSDKLSSQHGGPSDGFGNEFSSSSECVDSASKLQSSVNARQQKKVDSKLPTNVREQPRHDLNPKPDQGQISSTESWQRRPRSLLNYKPQIRTGASAAQRGSEVEKDSSSCVSQEPLQANSDRVQISSTKLGQRKQRNPQNYKPQIRTGASAAQRGSEVEEDSSSCVSQEPSQVNSDRGSSTLTYSSRTESSSDQELRRLKRIRSRCSRRKSAREPEASAYPSGNGELSVTVTYRPQGTLGPSSRERTHHHVNKAYRDFGVQTDYIPGAHFSSQDTESSRDDTDYTATSGYVLVINNTIFPQRFDVEREGSNNDVRNLTSLFDDFNFTTRTHNNLTQSDMLKLLTETAEKDFSRFDCFVCVILSHGSKDGIYGTDDMVIKVEAITKLFRRDECPSLEGKPKIFLIQACRGSGRDRVPVYYDGVPDIPSSSHLPEDADFLICFASTPGHQSYRHPELGSWFISAVVDVFKEYADRTHLLDMMVKVNNRVAQFFSREGLKQIPCQVCMLTRSVFFDPKYSRK